MASKKRSEKCKAKDKVFMAVARASEAADAHCDATEAAAEEESNKAYELVEQAKKEGDVEKLYKEFPLAVADKLNLEHELVHLRAALLHAFYPDF